MAPVSEAWLAVLVVGMSTVSFKAFGPLVMAGRALPPRLDAVVALLAPAVLAALVVVQTVGGDRAVVVDERLAGVAAAALMLRLRRSILPAILVAAAVTALLRAM
jgi:uncharacterized membrane protein